jgi:uncharacterized protein YndB with AHSA1/START domain/ketosteroid isomerase-like protein
MSPHDAAEIARAYHERWTTRDFAGAAALLADTLVVEVPVNRYPTAEAFAAALASFGSTVTRVDLLAAMSTGHEAMVLYDLDAEALGTLRVAEHFTVEDGKITRIRQVHDTAAVRAAGLAGPAPAPAPPPAASYERRLTIGAPRERVFDAVGTVDGPRHWWTTIVTGSAVAGGQLRFGFAGLDEQIVMHVDVARPPAAVSWSCMAHTRDEEWTGTTLRFELTERGPEACELDFRHSGISPELVAGGWDHFLASLAAYAEHGLGTPYGA